MIRLWSGGHVVTLDLTRDQFWEVVRGLRALRQLKLSTAKVGEDVTCPVCGGRDHIYQRTITRGMVRVLSGLARYYEGAGWVHVPTIIPNSDRDFSRLKHWGLIEAEGGRQDNGARPGYWRITPAGRRFLAGGRAARRVELIRDEVLRFSSETVTVRNVWEDFDLGDVMFGERE